MSSPEYEPKPTKRQLQTPPYESEGEDERDVKEELPSPKKRSKTTPKKKAVRKTSPGSTPKKAKTWPGHEILKLLELVNPKPTGIPWAEIAKQMDGRDEKSCQNKYARIQPKLREAILALGD